MIDQGLKDERIARLAEDYLERKQRGESIDLSLFLRDYPDLAGEVADYIQLLEMMDGTRPNWTSRRAEKDRERIGDFRLIRLIGQGGMGLVFEAMQESLGRTVALKLMKQTSREPATIARFTREARAAARLHHTNIVAVYGVGIDQGEHYLALQYIKGISLDRLLQQLKVSHSGSTIKMKRTGSTVDGVAMPQSGNGSTAATSERDLTEKILHEWVQLRRTQPGRYFQRMSSLIADIADALEHAHSHGILHRDIKPSNLILDAEGVLWITDFGLARINEEENITQSGQLVGTLRYLAPERLKRRENHQSDQYSLAATLYELLTLQPVYDAPTSQELLLKISQQEPLPPTRHTPSLSMDLQTILLKALSRDPDHRYARTSEFGNDLRRYVEGQPIRARRMGYASQAYRWAKRNPLVSGLIAAIFVTLITGLAVSTVFYLKADADRITAGASEQKANRAASEESKAKARSDKIKNFFIKEVLALAEPTKKGRNVTLLDALGDATARVPVIFARDPQLRAEVHTQLGELYREIGKTPSAIEQHQQALEIRQKLFGPESMEANRSIINIALSRMDEGKLQEAETTLTKMLPIFEKELGIDDAQTITIRDNLGVILEKLGKYSEAIPYQRYALEFARDRHGPNNDLTLNAQNNYGLLLVKAKRYDEAFAMLEDLISKLQQRFSPDHHRVLVARNNLMTMAFQRQQYRHAMTQAREILEAQQRKAGDSDPLTLMYMNNLGTILIHVDRKESQQVLLKAIALMEKHLSPNHPHRLSAYHNLGSCYNYDEEYELAEKYLLRALSGRREILPEKHPERLATLLYLGQAMQGQKKYEAAIQFFQEALTQQSKLQERDATMLLARRCCAQCYLETGKLKEAEALVLDNLRRVNDSATHGKDHQLNSELLAKLKVMRSTPTDSSGKQ